MDRTKSLEESLRESSCIGDVETVEELLSKGISVNSKHALNGWTSLHWAAKRSHKQIVTLLLANGADPSLLTAKGERAVDLCSSPEIRQLLGADPDTTQLDAAPPLPITPAYLKYEPVIKLGHKCRVPTKVDAVADSHPAVPAHRVMAQASEVSELVIKVRVANSGDRDFIEVELPRAEMTYSRLLRVCCEELGVNANQVMRVRKLPDTVVRKDKDVQRFHELQEVELVLATADGKGRLVPGSNGLISSATNAYQSISLYKNQTILY